MPSLELTGEGISFIRVFPLVCYTLLLYTMNLSYSAKLAELHNDIGL